jgi:DNA-directed RNA polymerase subunit RPC12/RpoP
MNKTIIRCRCGHNVLGREVLRTESYERASGSEVVYVKYRCRRCKKMGESFIPRDEWDWSILETPRDEMDALERDRFIDIGSISSGDVISFHSDLQKTSTVAELVRSDTRRKEKTRNKSKDNKGKDNDRPSPDKSHSGGK